MTSIGATPLDGSTPQIPLGTVISPNNTGQTSGGNVIPVPLMGHDGAFLDNSQDPMTAVMMAYLYPRIVQKGHNITGSGGKTNTYTFSNNNNYGNSIVVQLGMGEVEGANITLAVTDSNSNSYQKAISASQSTILEAAIFFATSIAAGSNTVTITIAGSSSTNEAIACEVYEVWGPIALAGSLDQTNTGSAASGTAVTTGAIVPYVPNTLAFMAVASAGGTITAGPGWTSDTSGALSPSGGNLVSFEAQSQTLTTIVSVTPSATLGTSNAWAAVCATFKSVIVPVEGSFNLFQVGGAIIALGSKTSANSFPVVIASDQGAVAIGVVDGTSLAADQSNTILKSSLYVKKSAAADTVLTLGAANSANSVPVVIANDQTVQTVLFATSNTSVGTNTFHLISAGSTNAISIKGSAGQVYGWSIYNAAASVRFVKLYNKATAPTAGTDTPVRTIGIPAGGSATYFNASGISSFTSGIGLATVTGIADNNSTAVTASDLSIDIDYV